jgi:hypothetical protein
VINAACCRGNNVFPMKVGVSVLALSGFALASTSTAHSEESSASDSPQVLTVRAGLPFTGVVISERFGAIKLAGLSASLRLFDLAEAEIGVPFWASVCESGPSYGGRVGVSPSLVALPATRTGWNVRLPVLFGYDFFAITGGGCEYQTDSRVHVATAATGLDFSYFWSSSTGVLWTARATHETQDLRFRCTNDPNASRRRRPTPTGLLAGALARSVQEGVHARAR